MPNSTSTRHVTLENLARFKVNGDAWWARASDVSEVRSRLAKSEDALESGASLADAILSDPGTTMTDEEIDGLFSEDE